MKKISIQRAANGYIVTDGGLLAGDQLAPPRVFESFGALSTYLQRELAIPNSFAEALVANVETPPGFVRTARTAKETYCEGCQGFCRFGKPIDADGNRIF